MRVNKDMQGIPIFSIRLCENKKWLYNDGQLPVEIVL
jgi:hypothetical protein